MKKRLNLLALAVALTSTFFWIGCGGNDNDTSVIVAAPGGGGAALAPASAADMAAASPVMITAAGKAPLSITFTADGHFTLVKGTNTTTGTFSVNKTSNNDATIVLTENSTPTTPGTVTTVQLHFTDQNTGSFSSSSSTGETSQGNFSTNATQTGSTTAGGTTGGGTTGGGTTGGGTTGGGTTGGGTTGSANAPASLTGRSMNVILETGPFPPGTSYNVTFNSATGFTSQSLSSSGNYSYTPSGQTANLVLNYSTGSIAGSQDVLNITFTGANTGTFTGTTKEANGNPQNFSGRITLQ